MTPDSGVQVAAPEGLDCRLNPLAAPCVPSIAGPVQVTVRLLPVPCASDTALGAFGICSVGVGVCTGSCVEGCIVAETRLVIGVARYIGIFGWVPVGLGCKWCIR